MQVYFLKQKATEMRNLSNLSTFSINNNNRNSLLLSFARSIAKQAVLHSCSSGEGIKPATDAPGVWEPLGPLLPKAGNELMYRACHQLWSSFDIT